MNEPEDNVSAACPFESHFVEVRGSRMHYLDEGEGDPILFLHGNPTSSYLWRNIIPHVTPFGRAVVPDLIGMGRSDKPAIGYRFFDHVEYVESFIEALDLRRVVLVVHDWGSALGFHYARRHDDNVRGLAFLEAILGPSKWSEFPSGYKLAFKMFRTPLIGWMMISVGNVFVNRVLPRTVMRRLGTEEMRRYRQPYPTWASRKPVRRWPCEIPIDGKPADVHEAVVAYRDWLQESSIPKLMMMARPGAIMPKRAMDWAQENLPALEAVEIGKGLHFVQEDQPARIGRAVARWLERLDA